MYNWIDGRKFSNSKSLLTFNLTLKHLNSFIKNGSEPNSFSQLPVIKEEGLLSEDEEELSQELLQSNLSKNSHARHVTDSNGHLKSLEKQQNVKIMTKLPPLMNINCLMNTEIKQTKAIWNTNFGKRLLNATNVDENLDSSSDIKRVSSNYAKNDKYKFEDCKFLKSTSKQKCTQEQNIRHDGGDKIDIEKFRANLRKPKKIKRNNQNLLKKKRDQEKKSESQLSEKFQEISSKELLKDETVSSFSKKQKFLTEYVKSILDCYSTQVTCEYCNEKLPDIEKFNAHKKQHETEKEICLLCDKIFYNSIKFTQHLLTHESVDQFSCKKCKKYFPNLNKYEKHCQDFHFVVPDNFTDNSSHNFELEKQQQPKFKCNLCKVEFDSKKVQENHKRHHTEKNLPGAYLTMSF